MEAPQEWLIVAKWFDPDSDRRGSQWLFGASLLLHLHNCQHLTSASSPEGAAEHFQATEPLSMVFGPYVWNIALVFSE